MCVERRERPQKSCARQLGVEEEAALQGGGANIWYSEPCRSESVVARRTSCEMEADGARRRMVAMRCRYVKMAVRSCHKKSRRDADDGGVMPSSSWKVGVKPTKVAVRCRLAKTAW